MYENIAGNVTIGGQSNNSCFYVIFQIQQDYGLLDNLKC